MDSGRLAAEENEALTVTCVGLPSKPAEARGHRQTGLFEGASDLFRFVDTHTFEKRSGCFPRPAEPDALVEPALRRVVPALELGRGAFRRAFAARLEMGDRRRGVQQIDE